MRRTIRAGGLPIASAVRAWRGRPGAGVAQAKARARRRGFAALPAEGAPEQRGAGQPFFPLVSKERDLFRVLAQVRQDAFPDTTLRVAGGWVRDRILGRRSNDIDIALDGVDGLEFALHF